MIWAPGQSSWSDLYPTHCVGFRYMSYESIVFGTLATDKAQVGRWIQSHITKTWFSCLFPPFWAFVPTSSRTDSYPYSPTLSRVFVGFVKMMLQWCDTTIRAAAPEQRSHRHYLDCKSKGRSIIYTKITFPTWRLTIWYFVYVGGHIQTWTTLRIYGHNKRAHFYSICERTNYVLVICVKSTSAKISTNVGHLINHNMQRSRGCRPRQPPRPFLRSIYGYGCANNMMK